MSAGGVGDLTLAGTLTGRTVPAGAAAQPGPAPQAGQSAQSGQPGQPGQPGPLEPDEPVARRDARRLPAGVAVLTTVRAGAVHGATVSTVSIVSQRPPTLAASLRSSSVFSRYVADSGVFVVNVLSSAQATVADWFADPARPPGSGQFAPIAWEPDSETGIPLLHGCLAHLTCRLVGRQPVGEVDGLLIAEITGSTARPFGSGRPLVGFDGRLFDAELHPVARRRRHDAAAVLLD